MSDELRIRRYEPSDHERVLELHERALRDAGGYVEDVPDEAEADLDDIAGTYLERGAFVVGERANATDGIVAMGGFRPFERPDGDTDARTAEVKRMRVAPDHQRQGHGTAILQTVETTARDRGFERMVLDTGPGMTAARSFYERHGYEKIGRETFRDGEIEVVLYAKELRVNP